MHEINFDNPILRNTRFCRRIVSISDDSVSDKNWAERFDIDRLRWGGGGIVITKPKIQLPKGVEVAFELNPGDDMSGHVNV